MASENGMKMSASPTVEFIFGKDIINGMKMSASPTVEFIFGKDIINDMKMSLLLPLWNSYSVRTL